MIDFLYPLIDKNHIPLHDNPVLKKIMVNRLNKEII